ncbi:alpha-1,4-glucan--maltose-1-phosphate maltosyltransferase [Fodinicurvata sp. EGI_FJ10296]|uniref:alpha-1,4-glucan--maltose-1-phosphate maltosyltransferase n=1 Tax=Fodinicurvata sp. EGI_FJ10296 TaxID=3231908 RepID=UPI0034548916
MSQQPESETDTLRNGRANGPGKDKAAGKPAARPSASSRSPKTKAPLTRALAKPTAASKARLRDLEPRRFVFENVEPQVNAGRYPVKRVVGDTFEVSADIVCDGHLVTRAHLRIRRAGEKAWSADAPMTMIDNDRWAGEIVLTENARHQYTIGAWVDDFATWRRDLLKRRDAGQSLSVDLDEGRRIIERAADTVSAAKQDRSDADLLKNALKRAGAASSEEAAALALMDERVFEAMGRWGPRSGYTELDAPLDLVVDPPAARFATWYEMFWRSQGTNPAASATVDDCIGRLDYIADLGFDVVYLVPHHPIGETNRKGRNNAVVAGPDDPGSPYAIGLAGAGENGGGHLDVNPDWGTLADFDRFVAACKERGLEVAIDFAIQCSPDHPWIKEHPDWFRWRPDGSIKFAENPPKKYEDIVNVEFYYGPDHPHAGEAIEEAWIAWRNVVLFWIQHGVSMFRVDNPHTKPLPFWEWLIRDVQERYPDTVFLAEAFTRPKVMGALAKLGFTQSYSYFTWRNSRDEMRTYLEELTQGPRAEYMRANFFPSTPDILPYVLQHGGRPAFLQRIFLAGTLSSVYGMYNGYELCENAAVSNKEEYLFSEKYEYKVRDWDAPGNIKDWVRSLNAARHETPALQLYDNLRFLDADNPNILVYRKKTTGTEGRPASFVLCAVNMDPHAGHDTWFDFPLWEFGLGDHGTLALEELFDGARFTWTGRRQHVWISNDRPAFMWRVTLP